MGTSKKHGPRSNQAAPTDLGRSTPDPVDESAPNPRVTALGVEPPSARWPPRSPSLSDRGFTPGGFLKFLQQTNIPPSPQSFYPTASNMLEQFNLVGGSMRHSSMSPRTPCSNGMPSPNVSIDADHAQGGSQDKETIDIDDDDNNQTPKSDGRSDRRLNWTHEDDIKLVSAWLQNSIDPIDGNDKKADQYWTDVTSTYNSSTEPNRTRNRNQLKLRWEGIKKPVSEFNGCHARITKNLMAATQLLFAPMAGLSEEALAERSKALECTRLALFEKE